MTYKYFWKMWLYINENTYGSCMIGHSLILSAFRDSDLEAVVLAYMITWLLDFWLWDTQILWLFGARQWSRGVAATSRKFFSDNSSETTYFL
jgi:hypothetical protein